jgi:hypothetical protein
MWSSMLRSAAEVVGVKLVSGTYLGRSRDRWMERGRNGKRESGRRRAAWARAGPSR